MNQKVLLDKFRATVEDRLPFDYMKKEIYLVKWLRSSNFQPDSAKERLYRHLRWRSEHGIDEKIDLQKDIEGWRSDFLLMFDGRDKSGRPFVLIDLRNFDARRLIQQGKYDQMVRLYEHMIDRACKLGLDYSEKYKNITRGNVLVNLDGFNPQENSCSACIAMMVRNIATFVQNYPECVDKIFIINAPLSIDVLANIAKSAFSEEIRRNIFIYGKDPGVVKEALSQDFNLARLPFSVMGDYTNTANDMIINQNMDQTALQYLNNTRMRLLQAVRQFGLGLRELILKFEIHAIL
ncbi:protein real-time isoform X1 [Folsomia candida]|nr:protein real-time isoform X1 [Folsomia candida]